MLVLFLFFWGAVGFPPSVSAHTVTISGYIQSSNIYDGSFTIQTPDGLQSYKVQPDTVYIKRDGSEGSFQDVVAEGKFVIVSFSSDDPPDERVALKVMVASQG